jgi:hypothetical protein
LEEGELNWSNNQGASLFALALQARPLRLFVLISPRGMTNSRLESEDL